MTADSSHDDTIPAIGAVPDAPFDAVSVSASLTVGSVQRSAEWYCDVLGFTLDERFEREGRLLAASLKAGAVRLLLTQDDGAKGDRVKGEGFSLMYSTAQDVDALAKRIESRGGVLDAQPADAWRSRVFRLRDPDGFRLVISSKTWDEPGR